MNTQVKTPTKKSTGVKKGTTFVPNPLDSDETDSAVNKKVKNPTSKPEKVIEVYEADLKILKKSQKDFTAFVESANANSKIAADKIEHTEMKLKAVQEALTKSDNNLHNTLLKKAKADQHIAKQKLFIKRVLEELDIPKNTMAEFNNMVIRLKSAHKHAGIK